MMDIGSLDEPFNFDEKKSKFDKNELLLIVGFVDSDLFESFID
jgi:hypothetical protein